MIKRTLAALSVGVAPILLGVGATPASASGGIGTTPTSVGADSDAIVDYATVTTESPPSSCFQRWMRDRQGNRIAAYCFQSYGDMFWIRDYKADGLAVRMVANVGTSPLLHYGCKASAGAKENKWQYCKFSSRMPENKGISYYAALTEDGVVKATSGRAIGNTS